MEALNALFGLYRLNWELSNIPGLSNTDRYNTLIAYLQGNGVAPMFPLSRKGKKKPC